MTHYEWGSFDEWAAFRGVDPGPKKEEYREVWAAARRSDAQHEPVESILARTCLEP